MGKKGQNQLDWMIGLALFFVAFSLLFFYLRYYFSESKPMNQVMENFAYRFLNKIPEKLGSNVVLLSSEYSEKEVETHPFIFTIYTNESVSFINPEKSEVLPFDKISSYKYRVLISFPSEVYAVISKNLENPCLSDIRNYTAYGFENDKVFIAYSTGKVETNIANVENAGQFIKLVKNCTFGEINASNEKVLLDAFSPRIWIIKKNNNNVTLSFNASLFSNISFSDGKVLFSFTNTSLSDINWMNVSFKGNLNLSYYKMLAITNESDVYLYNKSGEIILNITNGPIEIFYSNTTNQFKGEIYYYSRNIKLLPKFDGYVIRFDKVKNFENEDPTLSSIFGDFGKNYNITIANYSFGYKPPLIGNVYVINIILPILYDNGVLNATKVNVKIWQ